jgi:MFS family permease
VAGVLVLLFFAAAAPSPLYTVYQARWRFSATTLTAIFAAYALLLLITLLVFGSFALALPCLIAVWMLSGFYLSLGPSLAAQVLRSPNLLTGTAVAGAGFGTAMTGAFRTISVLAPPGQRAGLIATYFIVSYVAFGIPVVVAGLATTHVGLHRTALVYCVAIAVLAAVAAGSLIFRTPVAPWLLTERSRLPWPGARGMACWCG